ncbi:MAG: hypothetical protein ACREYB_06690 [Casimicrobiaceae bacterium]
MRKISVCAAAFGLAVGIAGAPAEALTCNIVFDRNDQVIYRDTASPVDLSDRGARARAAMRQRGEYLMVIDTDRCARVVPTTANSGAASVEDIVAGMRPYLGAAGGRTTPAAGGVASNARSAAPAAVSSSRGSSTRAY